MNQPGIQLDDLVDRATKNYCNQPRRRANNEPGTPDDLVIIRDHLRLIANNQSRTLDNLITIRVYCVIPLKGGSCTSASPSLVVLNPRISELYPDIAKDLNAQISCLDWFKCGVPTRYDRPGGGADTTMICLE